MKRRTFLATVGASAAVALWPRLIRDAFADASFDAPGATKTAPGLASARARALEAKRPLFVIVVPADDQQKYRRGELWGEYLNHAAAAELAPLAAVEVGCATMSELGPLASGIVGEPLAVVVAPDGRALSLDTRVPSYQNDPRRGLDGDPDEVVSARRIGAVAAMVAAGLPPVAPDGVRHAAARVIGTLRQAPPPGSHWANRSGCGPATVEGMNDERSGAIGCGMGHVPAKAARFLYFFAKSPSERSRIAEENRKSRR